MIKVLLTLIVVLIFFASLAKAQVYTLLPYNVSFVVYVIELYPVDDYTGEKQFIGIFGDKTRVDILWDARYNPEALDPINVTCWLNCKSKTDITQCYGQQNCSFQGRTGPAACTIFNPNYNYSSINNVTCRFFNPNHPEFEYRLSDGTYPQRVFYPVRYSVSVSGGTYLVGKTVELPITFISYSFLSGNYTGLAYATQTSFISIDNSQNTTKVLRYLQIDSAIPKLTVIYADGRKTTLYINTTANELPSCSSDINCPPANIIIQQPPPDIEIKCIEGKCQYIFKTEIGSAYLSLPEYSPKDIIIIVITSLIIFLAVFLSSKEN